MRQILALEALDQEPLGFLERLLEHVLRHGARLIITAVVGRRARSNARTSRARGDASCGGSLLATSGPCALRGVAEWLRA